MAGAIVWEFLYVVLAGLLHTSLATQQNETEEAVRGSSLNGSIKIQKIFNTGLLEKNASTCIFAKLQ